MVATPFSITRIIRITKRSSDKRQPFRIWSGNCIEKFVTTEKEARDIYALMTGVEWREEIPEQN